MEIPQSAINTFVNNDNPIISLLAIMVVVLAGVVIYQWRYTQVRTVPKWIWDSFVIKIDKILDAQDRLGTIIDERLRK